MYAHVFKLLYLLHVVEENFWYGWGVCLTRRIVHQDILETWRLRTPNEWEPLGTWADVLNWRNAIYNVVINAFKNVGDMAPHLHQLGYRDKAWFAPLPLPGPSDVLFDLGVCASEYKVKGSVSV